MCLVQMLLRVEPRLMTTTLIRQPHYYDHFFVSRTNPVISLVLQPL